MAKLGRMLQQLDSHRLPVHILPVVRQMFETMAASLPSPLNLLLTQLLDPGLTDQVLDQMGIAGYSLDPLLHNTVNATIVNGGDKINVIPSKIVVEMDGRLLPGCTPDEMIAELHQVIGDEIEVELVRYDQGRAEADMGLFDTLADVLRQADPEGMPVPQLMPAVTDGRFFSRLGIQTYGFTPMVLPDGFNFIQTVHAADGRIPVEAVEFGTNAVYEALRRFGG